MFKKIKEFLPVFFYVYLLAFGVVCLCFIQYGIQIHFSEPIIMGVSYLSLAFSIFVLSYIRNDLKTLFKKRSFFNLLFGIVFAAFCGFALFDFLMIILIKLNTAAFASTAKVPDALKEQIKHGMMSLLMLALSYFGYRKFRQS